MPRKPRQPDPPDLIARRLARQAAEHGWLALKGSLAPAAVEVADPIAQHLRACHDGREAKVWRKGDAFGLALDGRVVGFFAPGEIAAAVRDALGLTR